MEFKIIETWLSRKPAASAYAVALVSTLTLVFMSVLNWSGAFGLDDQLVATGDLVFKQHEWWRLFTSGLVHADLGHLLSNGLLFFILAYYLAGYFSPLLFPGLAFVFGGLINVAVLSSYAPGVGLLGASGIVYWMGGVWLALYVGIERRRRVSQRLLRAVGVGLLLFLPSEAFDPKISYLAHAYGFVFGVLTGAIYFFFNRQAFRAAELYEIVLDEPSQSETGPDDCHSSGQVLDLKSLNRQICNSAQV